ncbi:MAG: hypothetical protein O8C66_13325 [Candidatus Methanoperedens sp.]|nr:hypothetical protein [Candidatus Methanoperedens sp.]MCZ7371479.1 hypothetical protein [Candidatus Methanoperedens sp.]
MVEYKEIRVNSRELVLGLLIIFFSLTLGLLVPFVAPALCVSLLVTGVYAYRHAIDVGMRTIAIAAITGGILMFLMIIVIWLFMVSNITSTSSIENYPGR